MSLFVRRLARLRSLPPTFNGINTMRKFVPYNCNFSTDNHNQENDNKPPTGIMALFDKYRNAIMWSAGLGGAGVTMYGITSILYHVTTSLMTLTPATSLYYGFIGGAITAGSGTSMFVAARKLIYIHPETAWHAANDIINGDRIVTEILGVRTKSGSDVIKAYKHYAGGLTVRNNRPTWVNPSVDLLVKIDGEKCDALACIKISMKNMKEEVDYLCLYFDEKDSHDISDMLLVGDKKHNEFKDNMMNAFKF